MLLFLVVPRVLLLVLLLPLLRKILLMALLMPLLRQDARSRVDKRVAICVGGLRFGEMLSMLR